MASDAQPLEVVMNWLCFTPVLKSVLLSRPLPVATVPLSRLQHYATCTDRDSVFKRSDPGDGVLDHCSVNSFTNCASVSHLK